MIDYTREVIAKTKLLKAAGHNVNPNFLFLCEQFENLKAVTVLYGGARAGKTFGFIEFLSSIVSTGQAVKVAIVRNSLPALKQTVQQDLGFKLNCKGYSIRKHHENWEVSGSTIHFRTPETLRDDNYDFVYVLHPEELKDYELLAFKATHKHLILDTNNATALPKSLIDGAAILYTSFEDNPHSSQQVIEYLQKLEHEDPKAYELYCKPKQLTW